SAEKPTGKGTDGCHSRRQDRLQEYLHTRIFSYFRLLDAYRNTTSVPCYMFLPSSTAVQDMSKQGQELPKYCCEWAVRMQVSVHPRVQRGDMYTCTAVDRSRSTAPVPVYLVSQSSPFRARRA
ncbi:unnamed protein product, partial [Ectocarpus sp. 8 AP-2014]